MAMSSALTVLLFSLVLCTQALEQRPPLGRRSKRDFMASMASFFSNVEKRLAAVEARWDNTSKERVTEIEAKMHENMEDMEEKLQVMQDSMRRLESMMSDLEASLLATVQNNAGVVKASIARVEQTTKELATRVSAVEDKQDIAASLRIENTRVMLVNVKNTTKEMCGTPQYKRTCQEYYDGGQRSSDVYTLDLGDGRSPMEVYCDMNNGAGWVVFQRREDGSVSFHRDWKSYRDGFGDLYSEFWLGNKNIHRLTSAGLTQLRVDLQAWNGSTVFASYSHFSVGDASSFYELSVSGYSGTAGDSLSDHSKRSFSTYDHDADVSRDHCAQKHKGGWWYGDCYDCNPNGLYGSKGSHGWNYVTWRYRFGIESLQRTQLKLK